MKKIELPKLSIAEKDRVPSFRSDLSWGINDPDRFNALMDEATKLVVAGFHLSDNLFTWARNNSFLDDAVFRQAWLSNVFTESDKAIVWRRYILCCAAYHCIQLNGDFVECGALTGTGVKTVIDYFGKENFQKTFWVYDSFDYNPVEGAFFDVQKPGLFEKVKARFDAYDNVKLIQGLLPESLVSNSPKSIAYLHIDLNKAEFEIAVLEYLFDRVTPGGIVVMDDYEGSGAYRDQKIKEDAWFEARNYRVFPLPTGQGLIIKR